MGNCHLQKLGNSCHRWCLYFAIVECIRHVNNLFGDWSHTSHVGSVSDLGGMDENTLGMPKRGDLIEEIV